MPRKKLIKFTKNSYSLFTLLNNASMPLWKSIIKECIHTNKYRTVHTVIYFDFSIFNATFSWQRFSVMHFVWQNKLVVTAKEWIRLFFWYLYVGRYTDIAYKTFAFNGTFYLLRICTARTIEQTTGLARVVFSYVSIPAKWHYTYTYK